MTSWVAEFLNENPAYERLPVARRARRALHLKRPDGSIEALCLGGAIHYDAGRGNFQPIDTTLLPRASGYGAPGVPVVIERDGVVTLAGGAYRQQTARVGLFTPQTRVFHATHTLAGGALDDDQLVRTAPGLTHRLRLHEEGLTEELVVPGLPAGESATYLVLESTVQGVSFPDGEIRGTFRAAGVYFPQPYATDARGRVFPCRRFAATAGGVMRVYTGLALADLARAVFPVVIDPDFTSDAADAYLSSVTDTVYLTARATAVAAPANTSTVMIVGQELNGGNYTIRRGYLKFDTSSIGGTSLITQVNLQLAVQSDASTTDFDVQIVKLDWSAQDPLTGANCETPWDNALTAAQDDSIWRNTSGIVTSTAYVSGNLSTSWPNPTGATYYALRSSRDASATVPTGTEYVQIGSKENATVGNRPVLTIAYTTQAVYPPWPIRTVRLRR